jgi:hypothetical protein
VSEVATYVVGDNVKVLIEIDPGPGFRQVGAGEIAGQVRDAVRPAVEAAGAVLERVKALGPDTVEVKFGVKVSGAANWLVARAASEGNFEITLSWHARDEQAATDCAKFGAQSEPVPGSPDEARPTASTQ